MKASSFCEEAISAPTSPPAGYCRRQRSSAWLPPGPTALAWRASGGRPSCFRPVPGGALCRSRRSCRSRRASRSRRSSRAWRSSRSLPLFARFPLLALPALPTLALRSRRPRVIALARNMAGQIVAHLETRRGTFAREPHPVIAQRLAAQSKTTPAAPSAAPAVLSIVTAPFGLHIPTKRRTRPCKGNPTARAGASGFCEPCVGAATLGNSLAPRDAAALVSREASAAATGRAHTSRVPGGGCSTGACHGPLARLKRGSRDRFLLTISGGTPWIAGVASPRGLRPRRGDAS